MRTTWVLACLLAAAPAAVADSPPPGEDELAAQLKAVRKQLEELQSKEKALEQQLAEAKTRPIGEIKAEVRGILRWNDKGGGYYILVRNGQNPPVETRVWLWISEDKVLVRRLEGLTGKEVIAAGRLEQMPSTVSASVPPLGLYMGTFTIDAAPVTPHK